METLEERINDALAGELRAWAARKQLSKAAIAKRVHMSESTLGRYFSGKRQIPSGFLLAVAEAMGADPAALLDEAVRIARR